MTHCPQTQPVYYKGVGFSDDDIFNFPNIRTSDLGHNTPLSGTCNRWQPVLWPYPTDLAIGYAPLGGVAFSGSIVGVVPWPVGVEDALPGVVPTNVSGIICVPQSLTPGYAEFKGNGRWRGGASVDSNVHGTTPATQSLMQRWSHYRRNGTIQPALRGQSVGGWGYGLYPGYFQSGTGHSAYGVNGGPIQQRLLLSDGGLWDYSWVPMNSDNGVLSLTTSGGSIPATTTNYKIDLGRSGEHVGWRNIRGYIELTGSGAPPNVTRCELKVLRNTDWSFTGTPGTTVATITLTAQATVGNTTYYQGDGTNIAPPDGTLGVMYLQVQIDTGAGVTTIGNVKGFFSPRIDLSLPWTVSGFWRDMDYVIPGGYNASLVTAPDLRPPGALTGVYQAFDPWVCGDNQSVLVTASLAVGSYTFETDAAVNPTAWNNIVCIDSANSYIFCSSFTNTTTVNVVNAGLHVFKLDFDATGSDTIKLRIS